jgi:hypothetical protein
VLDHVGRRLALGNRGQGHGLGIRHGKAPYSAFAKIVVDKAMIGKTLLVDFAAHRLGFGREAHGLEWLLDVHF